MQVGLLNVDGYYNSLLSFIDKAVDEGFVTPSARHIIISAPTAHELMSKLEVQLMIHHARLRYICSLELMTHHMPVWAVSCIHRVKILNYELVFMVRPLIW